MSPVVTLFPSWLLSCCWFSSVRFGSVPFRLAMLAWFVPSHTYILPAVVYAPLSALYAPLIMSVIPSASMSPAATLNPSSLLSGCMFSKVRLGSLPFRLCMLVVFVPSHAYILPAVVYAPLFALFAPRIMSVIPSASMSPVAKLYHSWLLSCCMFSSVRFGSVPFSLCMLAWFVPSHTYTLPARVDPPLSA